jgi:multidrug efflux pump subunit AcrB
MPVFALKYPYFIIMLCLVVALVGIVNLLSMPVDLFPRIDLPVVVVATFYNGMPPQQIEADITNTFERFFTLAANVDHSESRSLTGVSLIKIYFKPGTNPDAALSNVANLAMADLRRLPQGTLPPVVLGMDASTQPVCLVTLNPTERSGSIPGAQPDFQRAGSVCTAALRWHLPADPDLRRSSQTRSAQPQPE